MSCRVTRLLAAFGADRRRWPIRDRARDGIQPETVSAKAFREARELDRLLDCYAVDIAPEKLDRMLRVLARLPTNQTHSWARPGARRSPLVWPGMGLAFGALLLGMVAGSSGLLTVTSAVSDQPDISDLMLQGA